MNKYVVLALSLFLSACASSRLTSENEERIKNVAIVSVLPEMAVIQKIGLTVFNNEKVEIEMEGQIRNSIVSTTAASVGRSRSNWTVKEISYDLPVLNRKLRSSGMVISSNVEKIQKDLGELAQQNGLDAILVYAPVSYDSIPGEGAGVVFRTFSLNSITRGYAHGNITLSIVDRRGEIIASSVNGSKLVPKGIDAAAYGIKYELKENLKPEIRNKLAADILSVVKDSVNIRLGDLGL